AELPETSGAHQTGDGSVRQTAGAVDDLTDGLLNLKREHDLSLQLLSCYLSACGSAELLEQPNERRALDLRKPTRRQVHRRLVIGEYLRRLLFARRRQPDDASPSVARVGLAPNQTAGFE